MRVTIRWILFFVILPAGSFAASNYPAGARALALSNAFISLSDIWSTFHNQAGIALAKNVSAGFYYESRFNVDELSLSAGTFLLPVNAGSFGLSFYQFGKGNFKEHKFGIAFGKQLSSSINAGVQLNYFSQTFPENQRAKGTATVEGGIIWQTTDALYLGAHIFNPFMAGFETPSGKQKLPTIFRIGGHYQFDEMVLAVIEFQKENNAPARLKTGIEFEPVEKFALRFGVTGKPLNYTAGMGYKTGKISADIGFSYHGNLGVTPSVSVQFGL